MLQNALTRTTLVGIAGSPVQFTVAVCPHKPSGLLGTGSPGRPFDFHTVPVLWTEGPLKAAVLTPSARKISGLKSARLRTVYFPRPITNLLSILCV